MSRRSRRNVILFMIFGTFTLLMCRCYDEQIGVVQYPNGWTCKSYTDFDFVGGSGYECTIVCPDGSTRGPIDGISDPVHPSDIDQSKVAAWCGVHFLTSTATLLSPTVTETSSVAVALAVAANTTPTITFTAAPVVPLLTGNMTACGNLGSVSQPVWWANLRLADPHPDIIGKNLQVTIGGAPAACGINQGNTSLLTCYSAKGITYPASVVVNLEGVEVNNFTINPNQSLCTPATATRSNSGAAPSSTSAPGAPPATQPPAATQPPVGGGTP